MIASTPLPQRSSPTALHGWRLHLVRAAWLLVVGCLLILYAVQLDEHLRNFRMDFFYDGEWQDAYPAAAGVFTRQRFAMYVLVLQLAATTACVVTGATLAWRRPDDWMVLLSALILIWAPLGFGLLGYTDTYTSVPWRFWRLLGAMRQFVNTVGMAALVLLFLVFPDGRFAPHWMKWALVPLAAMIVIGTVGLEAVAWTGITWEMLFGSLVMLLAAAVAAQIYRYRREATTAQRQQTRAVVLVLALLPIWLLTGLLIERFASPPWNALGAIVQLHLGIIVPTLIPLTLGIAALRYQLWDVAPIVRRTFVYTVLTLAVACIYILAVGAAASSLYSAGNLLLGVLVTGAVALLAHPIRQWLQRLVNRFLYGERDAPAAVLARLGERLEATAAAGQVLPAIADTVGQALKLPYVAVAVQAGSAWRPAASYQAAGRSGGGQEKWPNLVKTPIFYQRAQIAELWAAPRSAREQLTRADRALLEQVAQHAGPAIHAAQLAADLQRSREQIVLAAEEERRRLQRNLHDGLGPQLASLVLRVDAARNWLHRDPEQADTLLKELKQQMQGAVGDVRRIVYDLRPPVLDQLGLVQAVRQYAERAGGEGLEVQVQAPAALPALDAAVEVAAYRIILEALANVVNHAGARRCVITLDAGEELLVGITDDGCGLPANAPPGIGLRSMRARAEELGGVLTLGKASGGGTYICARLPLAAKPAQT
ncbi:MAG: histidine kinase [Caldilineaceae bacterium]